MVCNSCGAQNPDENLFCMKCGKQITPVVQQRGAVPGLHHVTERKLEGRAMVDGGNDVEPGDTAFLTKDIYVEGQLAFSDNEKVIVERIHASDQRSDYKCYLCLFAEMTSVQHMSEKRLKQGIRWAWITRVRSLSPACVS